MRNLAENAARYSSGVVALELREQDGRAVLVVDDDGPGIAPGDRDRVFDRFVRLDGARSREEGGAGLGLAIVHAVVKAHGGEVTAGSGSLGGARMEVTLPASES